MPTDAKPCPHCAETKSAAEFHKCRRNKDGLQTYCKSCRSIRLQPKLEERRAYWRAYSAEETQKRREYRRAWEAGLTPERARERDLRREDWRLRRTFGITLDDYNVLLELQGGVCAVCGDIDRELGKKLGVDHDHETGEIRGLLCIRCNRAIGILGDTPERIQRVLDYLTRPRIVPGVVVGRIDRSAIDRRAEQKRAA